MGLMPVRSLRGGDVKLCNLSFAFGASALATEI